MMVVWALGRLWLQMKRESVLVRHYVYGLLAQPEYHTSPQNCTYLLLI